MKRRTLLAFLASLPFIAAMPAMAQRFFEGPPIGHKFRGLVKVTEVFLDASRAEAIGITGSIVVERIEHSGEPFEIYITDGSEKIASISIEPNSEPRVQMNLTSRNLGVRCFGLWIDPKDMALSRHHGCVLMATGFKK